MSSPRVHVSARAVNRYRRERECSPGAKTIRTHAFHDRAIPHAKGFAAMRSNRHATLLAFAIAALLCAGHASAATTGAGFERVDQEQLAIDSDGAALKPGEYAWLPGEQSAGGGPITVLVNLRDQRAYLYRDGRRIAVTTVSTGTPGHDTPTGVFPIQAKEPMHHSKKYENAPMPWMQRLTSWGHALHAGHVRAGTASHGCVRLPAEFARQLYLLTRPGDLVVISQDDSPQALASAGAVMRSEVMAAGARIDPQRIAEAMRALGQPALAEPMTGGEVVAAGVTAF